MALGSRLYGRMAGEQGIQGIQGVQGPPGGAMPWSEVTSSTDMAVNHGYVVNNSSLVTLTLPAVSAFSDSLVIVGKGAGGWKIAQGSNQAVHVGEQTTTTGTGGHIESQGIFDAIELICTTASQNWTAISMIGNVSIT